MAAIEQWQINQLQKAVDILGYIVHTVSHEQATTYRDGGDGWTVLEVVGHLLDYEEIFLQRARLTVEQDNPELPFPNQDELVAANNYNAQRLPDVFARWCDARAHLVAYFSERSESDWERSARHPTRGAFTLGNQLALMVWHDMNHFEQIAHILGQQRADRRE